ncbi:MAG TPA: polysaccharide deacetylase family protein [Verrucomicrobiae bacterium]|jgi:peptidoglycan/xylan/chitin deacetylase (PgdA/CDA1 family)
MRLDRTLSLYLVRPLMKTGIVSAKRKLPILMYHSISDAAESGISSYYKTNTSPARFEQQMRWLTEGGFRSVDLEEGLRLAQRGIEKEKIVVITFDDGFRDFYDSAFPILKKYGHTATMFLPTAFLGEKRQSFKNKECLTWQEVRELRAAGIRFGSHTVNHPVLYKSSWPEIENELAVSKENLEQALGEKITSFAYPYALPQHDRPFVEKFQKLLRQLDYQSCATTVIGRVQTGDNPFCLKRLPMNNDDDQALFLAKLDGAYDWLAYPQSWFKSAHYRLGRSSRKEIDLQPMAQHQVG